MGEREQKAARLRELFTGQKMAPPKPAFAQTRPVRREVEKAVSSQALKAGRVFRYAMEAGFMDTPGLKAAMNREDSQLFRFYKMDSGKLFKNCKVQYGYNQRQNIYSIKVSLDQRPRIITIRTGKDFTEVSLADQKGKILETLRQQDGKGVTFSKTD